MTFLWAPNLLIPTKLSGHISITQAQLGMSGRISEALALSESFY